jgi:putative transposase
MPKLRHYDHLNSVRFITFSCYHRNILLALPAVVDLFLNTLRDIRRQYALRIFGYVVMPEHVHLVLHPPESLKLGPVIGELKSKSASRILAGTFMTLPDNCRGFRNNRAKWFFWQPRCYDHNCRMRDTILEKINYCHTNPVKRGLVTEPGQWFWSSYNWYAGMSDVPLIMDDLDGMIGSIYEKAEI